jgi:hypothetical protein
VLERLLEAVAQIDYPRDRFEIQVLDDSTDDSRDRPRGGRSSCAPAASTRCTSTASTARATRPAPSTTGLKIAKGELVAIFDADFVPQPDFLRTVVHHFADPKVGCVQARWGHLNRDHSILTRVQALMLDGHHMVENRARFGGVSSSTSRAPAASGAARPSATPAAGSTTPSPKTSTSPTARSSRAGSSSTARPRHALRAPRGDGGLPRAAVPLGQGHRADGPQAHGHRDALEAHAGAAGRGVFPPHPPLCLPAGCSCPR